MRTMLRRRAVALSILVFLISSVVGAGERAGKIEEITGDVVAFEYPKSWGPCYRRMCEGSLIVRIAKADEKVPRYIRVDFRYAESKPPRSLVQSKRRWRLKLFRTVGNDEVIEEFIHYEKDALSPERNEPVWKLVPGAEDEKLPFGEKIPSYLLTNNAVKPPKS
jgi:hypothetical protein